MSTTNEEMKAEGIEAQVCADIARRQRLGLSKYGTTVANNPLELRAWMQHAYEEMLDAAVYLRRAMADVDGKAVAADALPNEGMHNPAGVANALVGQAYRLLTQQEFQAHRQDWADSLPFLLFWNKLSQKWILRRRLVKSIVELDSQVTYCIPLETPLSTGKEAGRE